VVARELMQRARVVAQRALDTLEEAADLTRSPA
jgi:hypothetical protein